MSRVDLPVPSPPLIPTRKPRPIRLAFVLGDLDPWGTQRQGLQLAHLLNPAKYRVEIWSISGRAALAPLARDWGIPLVWLSRSKWLGPMGAIGLIRRLVSNRPDMLFLLTEVPNLLGRLPGRLAQVPLIVGNCRGAYPEQQLERWNWPLAHHLISNSLAVKAKIVRYGTPSENITVIHNGVDIEYFRPPGIKFEGPPVLISMARFVPDKDHETLVKAFSGVRQKFPEVRLWLLGEGPTRRSLQAWVGQNLPAGSVEFFGAQADVRPYLQRASLFVHSSTAEGMPNAVLEGMASGLPVVAVRAGGVPELVIPEETGLLVPPKDPQALGEAICRLLADPEALATMGDAGRRRAVGEFSFEVMVRRHEEIFDRLVDQRRQVLSA